MREKRQWILYTVLIGLFFAITVILCCFYVGNYQKLISSRIDSCAVNEINIFEEPELTALNISELNSIKEEATTNNNLQFFTSYNPDVVTNEISEKSNEYCDKVEEYGDKVSNIEEIPENISSLENCKSEVTNLKNNLCSRDADINFKETEKTICSCLDDYSVSIDNKLNSCKNKIISQVATGPIEEPQQLSELEYVMNDTAPLGNAGRLYVPSANISVRLSQTFRSSSDPMSMVELQRFTDEVDNAAYADFHDEWWIGDHWNQTFANLKYVNVGAKVYIKTWSGIQQYVCFEAGTGTNPGDGNLYCNGHDCKHYNKGGIIMYTCQGSNWHNIDGRFLRPL